MGNLAGTISGPAMVGASGTVSSIGAAFLGMLNPISLAVSAASIAGAAMAHWLWSSATGAGSLKDALADLGTEVEAYRKAVDLVNAPTAKLQERFGDAAGRAREILALLAEIKRGSVNDTLTDMLDKISNQGEWDILDRQPFGIRQWRWSKERPLDDLKADFRGLAAADNLDSQIVAANKLLATYLQLADASGSRNEQEKAFIKLLGETILELEAQKESEKVSPLTRQQQLGYEYSARSRQQAAGAQTEATGLLASLQQENSLRAASLQYGEGSLQVANLRADAERKAFEEMLAGLDVAESTKEELRAAFEEGQRLATADIAGGIRSAAAEALNLANRLNAAVGAAMSLASQGGNALREAQLKNEFKGDPVQLAKELAAARFDASVNLPADADPEIRNVVEGERRKTVSNAGEAAELDRQTAAWQAAQTAAARGSSGRGARQENDSVGDLISSLQAEGDILRETDPVQKEMLRYREKLAGATEKQRQEVEAKIASNIAERIQVEALQETWDFVGQSALSALDDMIVKGKSASDVVANLASALASAALQSALLGTGPLASLFGTAGTGGLLGAIFPGSIPAKADGGSISGPGTGTSDSVLMWASNGEFMVNAASTARYRPLARADQRRQDRRWPTPICHGWCDQPGGVASLMGGDHCPCGAGRRGSAISGSRLRSG